jgi:hypothetical protein
MGRGVQYFGLTLQKICRLALCQKSETDHSERIIERDDVIDVLEIEEAQASRFIREMTRRGLMVCIYKPKRREGQGQKSKYKLTRKWQRIAYILDKNGILPGTCQAECCEERAEPVRFRLKFFCKYHLMNIGCAFCPRERTDKCARCAERKN